MFYIYLGLALVKVIIGANSQNSTTGTVGSSLNHNFDWSLYGRPPSSASTDGTPDHQQSFQSASSYFSWEIQEDSVYETNYDSQESVPSSSSRPTSYYNDSSSAAGSTVDPCFEDKCENGATCTPDTNYQKEYRCSCVFGWLGIYCDTPDDTGENETTVSYNGTEEYNRGEKEELNNGTEVVVEPTENGRTDEELDNVDNKSTKSMNSTTRPPTGNHSTLTSPAITTNTYSTLRTKSVENKEDTTSLKTTTSDIIDDDLMGDDAVTMTMSEANSGLTLEEKYSTLRDDLNSSAKNEPSTTDEGTTANVDFSEASNGGTHNTTIVERGYSATSIESLTNTVSTEDGQVILKTTDSNIIQSTSTQNAPAKANGESAQETSVAITLTDSSADIKTSSKDTNSVITDGSSDSSQKYTNTIDVETFILIGLSVLISILLILIAVFIIKKRRFNNDRRPDTEDLESEGITDKIQSSTAYTNVAYDGHVIQTTNISDAAQKRTHIKSSTLPTTSPTSSSQLERSPSLSTAPSMSQQTCKPEIVQAITGQLENGVNFSVNIG